jgi:hypothetical protein
LRINVRVRAAPVSINMLDRNCDKPSIDPVTAKLISRRDTQWVASYAIRSRPTRSNIPAEVVGAANDAARSSSIKLRERLGDERRLLRSCAARRLMYSAADDE